MGSSRCVTGHWGGWERSLIGLTDSLVEWYRSMTGWLVYCHSGWFVGVKRWRGGAEEDRARA